MFATVWRTSASAALTRSSPVLPLGSLTLLNPSSPHTSRSFSSSSPSRSRIGRTPIALPSDVKMNILEPTVAVDALPSRRTAPPRIIQIEGPLGTLSLPIPDFVQIYRDEETNRLTIAVLDKSVRKQREMWGTIRARLYNNILGVSEGHTAILRMNGVGYRASIEPTAAHQTPSYPGQKFLSLKLGYSHPVDLPIPERVKTSTPQPTRILLEGIDKDEVTQFAAEIRGWKRPEPYKGKGIFLGDETIRLKAKKIK